MIGNLKEEEQNTLYNMLSVSLETGPQLTLQFVVFVLYYRKTNGKPPTTLMVSILASVLSGSVNGGFAVLGVSCPKTRDTSWRVKMVSFITAGLFTTSALLLQCLTYTVLMLWGWNNGYPIAAYVTMELSFYFILFMILLRKRRPSAPNTFKAYCNGKRFLHCVALSYLSAKIGPLQPLTNDARVKGELGKAAYWYRLLLVSVAHLCLYGGVFLFCLIGPSNSRWSNLCPKDLSILPEVDDVKGFPCRWYVPATVLGMLMYSLTIASHILMDSYVNKKKAENGNVKIYPVLPTNPFYNKEGQAELECTAAQIDDTYTSKNTEPQTNVENSHKGYADEEEGEEESEDSDVGKHHGEEIQIACEVATGEADSGTELQRSQGQVELSNNESKEEHMHQITTPACEEPVNEWVINTVGAESCEATRESTSIPTENIGFQAKQEQELGEEGMEVDDADVTPDEFRRLEPARL